MKTVTGDNDQPAIAATKAPGPASDGDPSEQTAENAPASPHEAIIKAKMAAAADAHQSKRESNVVAGRKSASK